MPRMTLLRIMGGCGGRCLDLASIPLLHFAHLGAAISQYTTETSLDSQSLKPFLCFHAWLCFVSVSGGVKCSRGPVKAPVKPLQGPVLVCQVAIFRKTPGKPAEVFKWHGRPIADYPVVSSPLAMLVYCLPGALP